MHIHLDLVVLILGQGWHMDDTTCLKIRHLGRVVVEELDYVFLGLVD